MFARMETLGSRLLERIVPKVAADASSTSCDYQYLCVRGTSGCNATRHTWWKYRLACSDGSTGDWIYGYCDNCTPGDWN
ncbi:hypothetical protein [Streptomyces sp. C10]|uniref:hypothetical protein n=1 Tax=Streptomyces sp. C10 TaxID=531941 RepID=UPI00397EC921